MDRKRRKSLTVKLDYGARPVRFAEFKKLCNTLHACVAHLTRAMPRRGKRAELAIQNLASGSVCIEMCADEESLLAGEDLIERFDEVLVDIDADEMQGPADYQLLKLFRDLASPVTNPDATLRINGRDVTTQFIANIDRRMRRTIKSLGQLKGRLEMASVHRGRQCVIYPALVTTGIRCTFNASLTAQVGDSLERSVTVRGLCHYFEREPFPHLIEVESLTPHAEDDALPRLSDMRGKSPLCTGDLSSVAFVRSLRDA